MTFSQILCGVDFSEPSVKAFETAVELTRVLRAGLHVMHVIEADSAVPDIALERKATDAMTTLVESVDIPPDCTLTTEITNGRAFVELVNRARESGFDLIVLGAKGVKLPEEAVVGTTAERVVKDANCSVMIVRLD